MTVDAEALLGFFQRLASYPRVVIQAHDFPDHDAVASAFGLACLLRHHHIHCMLVYNGAIDRISLQNMIDCLAIDIHYWKDTDLNESDIIITVDGCVGEKNLTDLPGREIAVIDHHQVAVPNNLWFCDIRPDHGATATIIYDYALVLGIELPARECTALQIGLAIDTANLTRGFVEKDLQAFAHFHRCADQDLVNRICRNSLLRQELDYYRELLNALIIKERVAYAWLDTGCPKNMLGILGDFLLALEEIDIVILAARTDNAIQLSLRSECPKNNVADLVRSVLQAHGLGFGGGHAHMSGGLIVHDAWRFESDHLALFSLFEQNIRT